MFLKRHVAAGFLALLAASCSHEDEGSDQLPRDALVVALGSDIRGTEPGTNRDANTDTVMMHVFEGLVGYDERGRARPLLASRIRVSPNGLRYRFDLRARLRFHNGAPVTAREVVWSWHRYLDPRTGWLCRRDFDGSRGTRVEQVKADGSAAVVFTLSRPDPLLLSKMAAVQCAGSAILHPASVGEDGKWRSPIATGPYRIARWKRGEYVDLAPFAGYRSRPGPRDGYVGGKHARAAVRWQIIRDASTRLAALIKGQIDVTAIDGSAELRQVRRYPALRVDSVPNAVVNVVLIRPSSPLLADARIRRALALSIDRGTLVTLATADTATPNASLIPAAMSQHDAVQDEGRGHDLATARRLLAAAGYHGQPITLATNRRFPDMFDQALLVQAMARRAGINLELKVSEWASQLDAYQRGNFELMSFSYSPRSDPWQVYDLVVGDPVANPRKQWGDPRALALLSAASREPDEDRRQHLFDALHRLMLRDVPLIVLFNPADNNAVRGDVHGFRSWILGRARLWDVWKEAGR